MNDLQLTAAWLPNFASCFWDLLVIDQSVVLTQDETSLAFRDPQGSVTAHHKCGFNRQEMALLQSRSHTGSCKCEQRKNVRVKVGSSGGNGGGKLILYLLCQKVPSVSGDDTAPR